MRLFLRIWYTLLAWLGICDLRRDVIAILTFLTIASGCAHANKAAPTLVITADACERLAVLYRRPDIAEACRRGGDVAPILDVLLLEAAEREAARK